MTLATPNQDHVVKEIESLYPHEGEWRLIALKFNNAKEFFNTLDPAPFHMRELDADAAQWLLDAARDLKKEEKIKIVLYLPAGEQSVASGDFGKAIQVYFQYHALKHRQRLRHLMRNGRHTLFVGISFLGLCALVVNKILPSATQPFEFLHTSISILGWVAMWRPIDIFLYEWWPIKQDEKICQRLSSLPVEIRDRASMPSKILANSLG